MASKNLGAVIQRAISDGAFRRQLQSDPAAALRGFNLTPDEIAAVRSGDSSRLLSLGVDSRMSKAFALGAAGTEGATRQAMSGDLSGSTSSVNVADNTAGTREGLSSDQTSGVRATISDGGNSGAVHDSARASITTPQGDAYRAVNDPDATGARQAVIGDPTQAGARSTLTGGNADAYRAVNDPDGAGATRNSVSAPQGDAYRAINDPDSTGGTQSIQTTGGDSAPGDANIMADDNYSVASRMHDANVALPGSDVQHDPGFVESTHSAFIPSDSADVQREALDSQQHGTGDALGHTGDTADEHSWG